MSHFKVVSAELSDVPELVAIHDDSFKNDAIVSNLNVGVEPGLGRQKSEEYHRDAMERADLYGSRYFKVVDTTNDKIAGFAVWYYPVNLNATQKAELETLEKKKEEEGFAEGANVSLCKDVFGQLKARQKAYLDKEKDYHMHILSIAPEYQRRGLGSLLLAEGLHQADKEGAKTYIEASPQGLSLYIRHGWEPVADLIIDLKQHGIDHPVMRIKCLVRQPKKADFEAEKREAKEVVGAAGR